MNSFADQRTPGDFRRERRTQEIAQAVVDLLRPRPVSLPGRFHSSFYARESLYSSRTRAAGTKK